MTATVQSSASKGAIVEVFDHGGLVGSAPVDAGGAWTLSNIGLSLGHHSLVAKTANGQIASQPWNINVLDPLSLGTDHAMSVSDYYIVQGHPPVPGPANAQYLRSATGGIPPYSYMSSDVKVALVAHDGTVTAAGNGTATIIVLDSAGSTAQYRITFSDIQHVVRSDPVNWGNSEESRPWTKTALTREQMKLFYDTYSPWVGSVTAYLGWDGSTYWTSSNILGADTAWAFRLSTSGDVYDEKGWIYFPTVLRS